MIFNLVSFIEMVLVNLGMTTHAWLLAHRERVKLARQNATLALGGMSATADEIISKMVTVYKDVIAMFEDADAQLQMERHAFEPDFVNATPPT